MTIQDIYEKIRKKFKQNRLDKTCINFSTRYSNSPNSDDKNNKYIVATLEQIRVIHLITFLIVLIMILK